MCRETQLGWLVLPTWPSRGVSIDFESLAGWAGCTALYPCDAHVQWSTEDCLVKLGLWANASEKLPLRSSGLAAALWLSPRMDCTLGNGTIDG